MSLGTRHKIFLLQAHTTSSESGKLSSPSAGVTRELIEEAQKKVSSIYFMLCLMALKKDDETTENEAANNYSSLIIHGERLREPQSSLKFQQQTWLVVEGGLTCVGLLT